MGLKEKIRDVGVGSRDTLHIGVEEKDDLGFAGSDRLVDRRREAPIDRIGHDRRVRRGGADHFGCAITRRVVDENQPRLVAANSRAIAIVLSINGALRKLTMTTSGFTRNLEQ